MQAGFCEMDITPHVGMPSPGGPSYHRGTVGVATPLTVQASVWHNGETCLAIVGIDAVSVEWEFMQPVEEQLHEQLGIEALVYSASHTHTGGPISRDGIPFATIQQHPDLTDTARSRLLDRSVCVNEQYLHFVQQRVTDAVCEAHRQLRDVRLVYGSGAVHDVGYSRRIRMDNGLTYTNPGYGATGMVDYGSPIDPAVQTLTAVDTQDQVCGMLVNYGCHATVEDAAQGLISSDWPGQMRRTIQQHLTSHPPIVFLNGCCGNVTQLNYFDDTALRKGHGWAQLLGRRVGTAAIDAFEKAMLYDPPYDHHALHFRRKTLGLAFRETITQRYNQALAVVNDPQSPDDATFGAAVDVVLLHQLLHERKENVCVLQAIQIGNLAIVTNPTECFAQTGLQIKTASPFEHTMVAELANGRLGYLPPADVFGPCGGGYEGHLSECSFLEVDAERKVRETSIDLFEGWSPESVSERKPVRTQPTMGLLHPSAL